MNAKGLAVRWELRGLRYCGCLAGGFLTGKPLAVVAIGERAQPVLDLVRPEVGDEAEVLARQRCAFLGLGVRGVRHDVAKVHDGFAGGFQLAAHLVVRAAALDGTAVER